MRVRKQIPTMVNQQAPNLGRYHQGPILTNGALEFIFDKQFAYPLITYWGYGIRQREQFNVVQPPQLRAVFANTVAPIYGPGVPNGQIEFMRLLEETGANEQ